MDGLIQLLDRIPLWVAIPLVTLTILIILNKMADGKPGAFVAAWILRRQALQDRNYNAIHSMLRESIDEQGQEYKDLNLVIHQMTKSLGDGQASLAVKNSETRALISGMNVHLTRQHELLGDIIRKQDVLSEKIDGFTVIFMSIERRLNKDGT